MSAPRFIACFAVACCLTVLLTVTAHAQYMYLDSNGNGVNDPGDAVNPIGVPTAVDLYIVSNRNRDGSEVTCPFNEPYASMELFAYSVNLLATEGGTVTYSNYVNRQPLFGFRFNEFNPDGVRYETGFIAFGSRLPPGGPYLMATLTITAQTGSPRIEIVPQVEGALDPTFLGLGCVSSNGEHSWRLGSDWFDVDGLRPGGTAVNHRPVLEPPSDMAVEVGEFASQVINATDPDRQLLAISLRNGPRFAFLSSPESGPGATQGALHLAPRLADVGTHEVSIVATDGALEDTRSIRAMVTPGPNHAPLLGSLPPLGVVAGRTRRELVFAGDADGSPLEIRKLSGPEFVTVRQVRSGEGGALAEVLLAPAACESGSETLVIQCTDGAVVTQAEIPIRVYPLPKALDLVELRFPVGGQTASDVSLADFNQDGILDAVVSFESSHEVAVFLGDGLGGFVQSDRRPAGRGPWSVATGDLNADGIVDVAVTDSRDVTVTVFLGNGNGTLQPGSPTPATSSPHGIRIADMNSDGRMDLVVAGYGAGEITVLLGRGDGTFNTGMSTPVGQVPMDCAISDFDSDGRPDVAVTTLLGRTIDIRLGTGGGVLLGGGAIDLHGMGPYGIVSGDWNRDGLTDLAATNYLANTVQIFRGDGGGGFALVQEVGEFVSPPTVLRVGDFDQDGESDLALVDIGETGFYVIRGQAGGVFEPPVRVAGPAVSFAYGDMDSDGNLDFFLVGGDQARVLLHPVNLGSDAGARGFLADGHRSIPDSQANSRVCLRLEPLDGSFQIPDLDPSTVRLRRWEGGAQGAISPLADKMVTPADTDRNGISEVPLWFARSDWAKLFEDVQGRQTVRLGIDATLLNGRKLCARFDVSVVGTGGPGASEGPAKVFSATVAPNPLNPAGVIRFTTTRDGFARIRICDVRGRVVRSLLDTRSVPAGDHETRFDGRSDNGESLASGIYFYHLETLEGVLRGRITVLK